MSEKVSIYKTEPNGKRTYLLQTSRNTTLDLLVDNDGSPIARWRRGEIYGYNDVLDPELYEVVAPYSMEKVTKKKHEYIQFKDHRFCEKGYVNDLKELPKNAILKPDRLGFRTSYWSTINVSKDILGISLSTRDTKHLEFLVKVLQEVPLFREEWKYVMYITAAKQDKDFKYKAFEDNGWKLLVEYENQVHNQHPNWLWIIRSDGTTPDVEIEHVVKP